MASLDDIGCGGERMIEVDFVKYEGLGNDFVLIDDLEERLHIDAQLAATVCNRHFGVGGDGLILVRPSEEADSRMVFFNPDGSQAEMCGNGVRAFAKYLYDSGVVRAQSLVVETGAGLKDISLVVKEGRVEAACVDMGRPSFAASDIPVRLPTTEAVNVPIEVAGEKITATCVSMGNPHCVVFVEDVAGALVQQLGPALERHEVFPDRTNVEFVQVLSPEEVRMRVWERGAGETLACGTGACATAVAAARTGRTGRRVKVRLPGGDLDITWEGDGRVLMAGPVREVFRGHLTWGSPVVS